MRKACIGILLTFICFTIYGQNIDALAEKAELQEKQLKELDALKTWQQLLKQQPNHLKALCHASEICSRLGFRQTKAEVKTDFYRGARRYAEMALKVNKESPEANVAMAVAMGRMALLAEGKEKIAAIKDIKLYGEEVLRLDKNNYKGLHILGKWHLELALLNSIQKTYVKMFYGYMPEASLAEAIRYFERSQAIEPGFLLNYTELARAYDKNNQRAKAIELLKKMLSLPEQTEEDIYLKEQAKTQLAKWTKSLD